MAKRNLSPLERWRKATLKQFLRDKLAVKKKAKKAAKKEAQQDLVAQWRALRKLGAYNSTDTPALKNLTRARAAAIRKQFERVQAQALYENGRVYRPLVAERSDKRIRYTLDKNHFTLLRSVKKAPPGTLKTRRGTLTPHERDETVRARKGTIHKTRNASGNVSIHYAADIITGLADFLQLIDDIDSGRVKLKKNQLLRLYIWGSQHHRTYTQNTLPQLAALLRRYQSNMSAYFKDFADMSEIVTVTRKTK